MLLLVHQVDEIVHEQNGAVRQTYDGDNHGDWREFFVALLALDGFDQAHDAYSNSDAYQEHREDPTIEITAETAVQMEACKKWW